MSDQPQLPAAPVPGAIPDSGVKPAKPGFGVPKSQQLTVTQQIYIWLLVLIVGVIFGVGSSSLSLLGKGAIISGNITENEAIQRSMVANKLQDALGRYLNPYMDEPYAIPDRGGQALRYYAQRIQLARLADGEGLLPSGKALDAVVKDFLNEPLPDGSGSTNYTVLSALRGDKAVTETELRRFLAERFAGRLMFARNVVAPAMPAAFIDAVSAMNADRVLVDETVLTAKHLLPAIKDDDADIQTTYDRLRLRRFARGATCVVTVAASDPKALADKIAIEPKDIEAYYQAHQPEFTKPAVAPDPTAKPDAPKPAAVVKPLAEVSDEIKHRLAGEKAEKIAKDAVIAMDKDAGELEGQKDNASFKAAAAKQGLAVSEGVVVDEPQSGALSVGALGSFSDVQLHLFTNEPGFVSSPIQADGHGAWAMLRIESKREPGSRELKEPEVLAAVKAEIAASRTYKEFLKAAEEVRAAAEKLGPGGLKAWAATPAAAPWVVTVATNPERAGSEYLPPAPEFGGEATGDGVLLASLTLPNRPVLIAQPEGRPEVPSVRLLQVSGYEGGKPLTAEERTRYAEALRRMLRAYRQNLYQTELSSKLPRN
ncbi:MAG: hypothetical protein H0X38_06820 [Planctomycetes bacterium]|nr:hypothetical protein [Planctomycetota bacterium]